MERRTGFSKRILIMLSLLMVLLVPLCFPSGIFGIDFGLKASAATIEPSAPTTGDGSSESPYHIKTAEELYWFAGLVNGDSGVCDYDADSNPDGTQQNTAACAKLTASITVNTDVLTADGTLNSEISGNFRIWTPIGCDAYHYTGSFDGQGFTVSGLYFNDSTASYVGLFGYVEAGSVSNVGIVDSWFNGNDNVGGVCGYKKGGTIENCYHTGTVGGNSNVGGVCGYNGYGTIENCYNAGTVSSTGSNVGGVGGYNGYGTIENCYNAGTVSSTGSYVGGVCGNSEHGKIQNSYNTGGVSGTTNVGGVCGYIFDIEGTITNCYNIGKVSGTSSVGGVCGFIGYYSIIENCYNTGSVRGDSDVGGVGGISRSAVTKNCYYLDGEETDSFDGTTFKTATEFNSGEVAYLLSQGENGSIWGQDLSKENTYPTLGGAKVYQVVSYPGCETVPGEPTNVYANEEGTVYGGHNYDNGFCTFCGIYVPATDSDGDGVYEISNAGQLYWFAGLVNGTLDGVAQNKNACAKLTTSITVNTGVLTADGTLNSENSATFRTWTPIGSGSYFGTFDGQGFTVSGLYFNDANTNFVGLFGHIGENGSVSNVGVVDSYFSGKQYVSGVCGVNAGTITNCYHTGTVSGASCVGGVCGSNSKGITNCYNAGIVSGTISSIGGVCGYNGYGTITNCYNIGTVNGNNAVGGVCGYNCGDNSIISNCHNTGTVSGEQYVGGVCGRNDNVTITNCYNTGAVSGTDRIGGVCGNNSGTITNCYNAGKVSGAERVGGVCGKNDRTIENCYHTGTVSGTDWVGGVCGRNDGTIENCHSTGTVSGTSSVGGVCGRNDGTITNCYYLAESETDEIDGTTFKTAAQFRSGEVAYLLSQGTNGDIWGQDLSKENTYPVFDSTKTVYRNDAYAGCGGTPNAPLYSYANEVRTPVYTAHSYENGFCTACDAYQPATDSDGDGYYEIGNAGQLYWFAEQVNNENSTYGSANAVLTADIVVNASVFDESGNLADDTSGFRIWMPIGWYNYENCNSYSYTGTFNGQGHTISGLYFHDELTQDVGLFGYVGENGSVSNVGVVDSYFSGNEFVGGVCGDNEGTIINCYHTGTVSGADSIGGVCGYNGGTIENCYHTGVVTATSENAVVGDVCGYNEGTVTNCYYLSDTATTGIGSGSVASKTVAQFYNGEVAYLLSQGTNGSIWGQDLSTDSYPVLGGAKVYQDLSGLYRHSR